MQMNRARRSPMSRAWTCPATLAGRCLVHSSDMLMYWLVSLVISSAPLQDSCGRIDLTNQKEKDDTTLPCDRRSFQKQAYLASSRIALHLAQFLGFIIAFGSLPIHFLYFVSIAVKHASRLPPISRFSMVDGKMGDLVSRTRQCG